MKTTNILHLILLFFISTQLHSQNNLNQFNKFISDGSGKSKGLKFQVKYPKDWESLEADRPNIVRKFIDGESNTSFMIRLVKMERPLTEEERPYFYTEEAIKNLTQADKYISIDLYQGIDLQRATCTHFITEKTQLDFKFKIRGLEYAILYKDYIIQLTFMTTINPHKSTASYVDELVDEVNEINFKQFEPLFKQIANSFIITSQWEN